MSGTVTEAELQPLKGVIPVPYPLSWDELKQLVDEGLAEAAEPWGIGKLVDFTSLRAVENYGMGSGHVMARALIFEGMGIPHSPEDRAAAIAALKSEG